MKKTVFTLTITLLFSLSFLNAQTTGPEQIDNGIKLWLDASDASTLYQDHTGLTPVTTAGQTIGMWKDKSGNGDHVIQSDLNSQPVYTDSVDAFNNKSVLDFSKKDYLSVALDSQWSGAFTLFVVIYSDNTNPSTYDAFFSNDNDFKNEGSMQIDFGDKKFRWRAHNGSGEVKRYFEDFEAQKLKLYTVNHSGEKVKLYHSGISVDSVETTKGTGFQEYRININRKGNKMHDSKIAEVILYDRALSACEMDDINAYLSEKYGQDFNNIQSNYDNDNLFHHDINGIGQFATHCLESKSVNTCTIGDDMKVYNPSSNDTDNEFMTFASNNGTGLDDLNPPLGFTAKLGKVWEVDEDGDLGTVDINFGLWDLNLNTPAQLESITLVVGEDTLFNNPTYYTAATQNSNSGTLNTITFENIDLADNQFFTIAFGAAALPVTCLEFQGQITDGTTFFRWDVADEIDVDYYTIKRSIDGKNFKAVGEVFADLSPTYTFVHEGETSRKVYYQLHGTDLDGTTYQMCNTIVLKQESYIDDLKVFPTQLENEMTIQTDGQYDYQVQIVNLSGVVIQQMTINQETTFDVSNYAKGIYFINLYDGVEQKTFKVIR